MDEDLRREALRYHRIPRAGKISVRPTKPMATQRDLALAYSPGVAAACEAIVADPAQARELTTRGNLVAVITNGTAVLGLGDIGPLAAKPVMEGKAALFKTFAGIDVFDLEVDAHDVDLFCNVVAALEPTFGGINLEDIKAPECFVIERRLRERMNIPVFHDDQHGTAIVCAAAILNGLRLQGKALKDVKLVTSGAGAAAMACVDLLVSMGLPPDHVTLTDIKGVVHAAREDVPGSELARYARHTDARILPEVLDGADVFLGLSAPRVLKPEWLGRLAPNPFILALANPEPEILPELAKSARPDAIVATGRSDYPNQVNNVLCFPFVFRGALDVDACEINEAMKIAAVQAVADLAREEVNEVAAAAYGGASPTFGPEYIIPKPFDPRLILRIAPAVARAAMDSGVARRPIADFAAYYSELERFVFRSGQLMRPVFDIARRRRRRVAIAQGEDPRVLRAAQTIVAEGLATPVLIGRRAAIEAQAQALGLKLDIGGKIEVLDPEADADVFEPLVARYQAMVERRGVPVEDARRRLATRPSVAAALLLAVGRVEAALCGGEGDWWSHMTDVLPIVPREAGAGRIYSITGLILDEDVVFIADTHVNVDPTPEQIAEMTVLAAAEVRRFGLTPRAALLSHSNFGASNSPTARKMREALRLVRQRAPELQVDGEMHADAALKEVLRRRLVRDSVLTGSANLLIMPSLDAANIALTLLAAATGALKVGPLLLGAAKPLHILTTDVTARGVVNMTALAAAQAAP
ncbi:NADP-dependent malic enzyme [Phenylobacterium sp.]|uniref:NADP-dependent malic enzyme n=1 Tax=Phenylobacterium sp. TaxID=1871053 RepID=UPI002F41777B